MKKLFFHIMAMVIGTAAMAQYKPVDQGSSVQFTVQNFGFDVSGSFTGLRGTVDFDPKALGRSRMNVGIDAKTVNTDNNLRDDHLRGDSYFDIKNHPEIHFESTGISQANGSGALTITGKLTIKNQTRVISFPFTATPVPDGYQFKGSFKINRKDFDVGGASTISNELQVVLNIVAKKG